MTTSAVINATGLHTATLIFLHGLGDTGEDWSKSLSSIRPPNLKVICPTAKIMPVTMNAGFKMTSWFDLISFDANGPEDEQGIKAASKLIHSYIEDEVKNGIPYDRILVGGFSQGGALALFASLQLSEKLGGVICLSAWLPLHQSFPGLVQCPRDLDILLCHGDDDPVIPYEWGQITGTILNSIFRKLQFKTFGGLKHGFNEEELQVIKKFIISTVP